MFIRGNGLVRRIAPVAVAAIGFMLAGCAEVMSRDDFAKRTQGKSDLEVRKDIGKPASVENKPGEVKWIYSSRTFNTEGRGKVDSKAVVVFSGAAEGSLKVVDVQFE